MVTFKAVLEPYNISSCSQSEGGLGWVLDSSRCAILVHDVLPYYLKVLNAEQQGWLIAQISEIVSAARQNSIPILASAPRAATTLDQRGIGGRLWGLGPDATETACPAVPEVHAGPTVWFSKRSLSAFFATDLDVELRRLGRDQLVIVGVFASSGVLASTFDALARDIECFVISDAVADYDQELHTAALRQVARSTGQILSSNTLLNVIGPHTEHTKSES